MNESFIAIGDSITIVGFWANVLGCVCALLMILGLLWVLELAIYSAVWFCKKRKKNQPIAPVVHPCAQNGGRCEPEYCSIQDTCDARKF